MLAAHGDLRYEAAETLVLRQPKGIGQVKGA